MNVRSVNKGFEDLLKSRMLESSSWDRSLLYVCLYFGKKSNPTWSMVADALSMYQYWVLSSTTFRPNEVNLIRRNIVVDTIKSGNRVAA